MEQSEKEKADLCPLLFKHQGSCVNYDNCEPPVISCGDIGGAGGGGRGLPGVLTLGAGVCRGKLKPVRTSDIPKI